MCIWWISIVSLYQAEWRYLLSGGMPNQELINPAVSWLSERAWQDILGLSTLHNFRNLAESFTEHLHSFKRIFDSNQPHRHTFVTSLLPNEHLFPAFVLGRSCWYLTRCVCWPVGSHFQEGGPQNWTHSRSCWFFAVWGLTASFKACRTLSQLSWDSAS